MKKYTNEDFNKNLERAEKSVKSKPKTTKEVAAIKMKFVFGEITLEEMNTLLGKGLVIGTGSLKENSFKKFNSKKLSSRVEVDMKTADRLKNGLVNTKSDVDYLLQSDGTKICKCCNKRKDSTCFSNTKSLKDGKTAICRECDSRRGITWRASKAA